MNAAKNMLSVIFTAIAGLAMGIALIYFILLLAGFRAFILDSTSMEPSYRKGSFIIADTHVHTEDLKNGDVVIYKASSDVLVMHRLIAENTLKGDANQMSEHIILNDENLVGRVHYSLFSPVLTQTVSFLKDHQWIPVVFTLAAIFFISNRRFSYTSAGRKYETYDASNPGTDQPD